MILTLILHRKHPSLACVIEANIKCRHTNIGGGIHLSAYGNDNILWDDTCLIYR